EIVEEDEESPEFPAELDEFLEFCVGEHDGDFEAISRDFLDIAAELEAPLAERASEFFSPAALQQRWALLCGEELEGEPSLAEEAQASSRSSVPATSTARGVGTSARGDSAGPPATPAIDWDGVAAQEEAPSGFSVFEDSLKEQIDQIYSDVQNRLPSAYAAGEDEDDEDEADEMPVFFSGGSSGSTSGPPRLVPAQSGLQSRDLLPGGNGPSLPPDIEGLAALMRGDPSCDAVDADELRQKTIRLFGTDDLSEIFTNLPEEEGQSVDLSSFGAILQSHGVDPGDIEGPMVEPPTRVVEPLHDFVELTAARSRSEAKGITPSASASGPETVGNSGGKAGGKGAGKGAGNIAGKGAPKGGHGKGSTARSGEERRQTEGG
ncbi:unnamed protein product, partial [Polarella glacialis]